MEGEKAAGPCKWQSASAGSGPQKGDMLSVVCSSVVVCLFVSLFGKYLAGCRKCAERGLHWHCKQGQGHEAQREEHSPNSF